jgi:type I restriction enzyme, S subunit
MSPSINEIKRFVVWRSSLNTSKLFVEFYLPKYMELLRQIKEGPFPSFPLSAIAVRMFDGPFGSNRKVDMYQDSGIPYIRVKDVLPEGINTEDLVYITSEKQAELRRSRVVAGNLLITIAGRLGTAAVFPESLGEGNITGHIVGIELRPAVNPYYLAAFINSTLGEFQVVRLGQRTTRPELNITELGQLLIPVPPKAVQDQVAELMQGAYATRRQRYQQITDIYRAFDSQILKALGIDYAGLQGDRFSVQRLSDVLGRRFDFEAVVTVRRLNLSFGSTIALGEVNERVTPILDCPESEVNFVSLGNIRSNTGELVDFAPVKGSDVLSSSPIFKKGDILYGRMRPYLNKVWLAEFDGVCSGEAIVLRPNPDRVNTEFLRSILLSRITVDQVVPLQTGTSLPRVSADDLFAIRLPIPAERPVQEEIAKQISAQRAEARQLLREADAVVTQARQEAERAILSGVATMMPTPMLEIKDVRL